MMKIRILYDEGGFYEPHGGVSRYFTEIMKRLGKYGCEGRLPLACTTNAYLAEPPFSLPRPRQTVQDFARLYCGGRSFSGISHVYKTFARMFPRIFPSGELANIRAVDAALRDGDFDIYHPTAPHLLRGAYEKWLGKRPMVVTVHDLIPEIISKDSRIRRNRKRALHRANAIIAVSENTKKDILRLYDVPAEKIHVVYHGYIGAATVGVDCDMPSNEVVPTAPYLMFVGKRGGYKNFRWFLHAVAPLLRDGLGLVCTGMPFTDDERALLASERVADRVWQRFCSDEEMGVLLRNALAFVYPSLYEGFGIPILDAFANQCPVVLSRASCFPEVAGDAALYFDLGDDDGLRNQIVSLMGDAKLRQSLIEKGCARTSLFSWDACAAQTAAVYKSVLCK